MDDLEVKPWETKAFTSFMIDPKNRSDLDKYNHELKKKYDLAKIFAETVDRCQKNILIIKHRIDSYKSNPGIFNKLSSQLISQQMIYGDCIVQLEDLKRETQHLKHGLEQAKIKALKKFRTQYGNKPVLQNISNLSEEFGFTPDATRIEPASSAMQKHNFCLSGYVISSDNSLTENAWTKMMLNTRSDFNVSFTDTPEKDVHLSDLLKDTPEMFRLNLGKVSDDSCSENQSSHSTRSSKSRKELTTCTKSSENCRGVTKDDKSVTTSGDEIDNETCRSLNKSNPKAPHSQDSKTSSTNSTYRSHCTMCSDSIKDNEVTKNTQRVNNKTAAMEQQTSAADKPKSFFKENDDTAFVEFMNAIPLTGDEEIDEEIFSFYRNKFNNVG